MVCAIYTDRYKYYSWWERGRLLIDEREKQGEGGEKTKTIGVAIGMKERCGL